MAIQYVNMGIVYRIRGDLDQALKMYEKALAINEERGRKEGMAGSYVNMGNVYRIRGDLDQALEMYLKSLKLFEEIGAKDQVAKVKGLIASLEASSEK